MGRGRPTQINNRSLRKDLSRDQQERYERLAKRLGAKSLNDLAVTLLDRESEKYPVIELEKIIEMINKARMQKEIADSLSEDEQILVKHFGRSPEEAHEIRVSVNEHILYGEPLRIPNPPPGLDNAIENSPLKSPAIEDQV